MPNDLKAAMDALEARFTEWAIARDDIRAAVIVGSRARTDHPADAWADLDVGMLATDPALYLKDTAWLAEIAPVWTLYRDADGPTHHVLFEGGLDAGIAVLPARAFSLAGRFAPALKSSVVRSLPFGVGRAVAHQFDDATAYYARGYRLLFDKDGVAQRFFDAFPAAPRETAKPPSRKAFREATNEFWFNAVWTAKHLERGELWFARTAGVEGSLRQRLLEMIEWHARVSRGADTNTWERGRFMEEWADPRVIAELGHMTTGYDKRTVRTSLRATMAMYGRLAMETAGHLSYAYDEALPERIIGWVEANTVP